MTEKDRPQLYREAALKRISTPEQLDQLIQITDSRGWIALLAVGLIILAGLAWAFTGLVDVTVTGTGILLNPEGIATLEAPADGLCTQFRLRPGITVAKGELIGFIAQPEMAIA